jgi:hypothetical protein
MAEDWTEKEVDIILADYFSMLKDELQGKAYNKSLHRRIIAPLLNNRNDGAIEFKHQNISAALCKFGVPWIDGYKPRWNYQKRLLDQKVAAFLMQNNDLEPLFIEFAESQVLKPKSNLSLASMLEDPPERQKIDVEEPSLTYHKPVKMNFIEIEQRNKLLGNSGEETAIAYERWRLIEAGKDSLADKIEWVAKTQGDGLGYDVLSKNTNGTDRYIEVKTTKLSKEAPIFFSKNEYAFSLSNSANYYLYRLFKFNSDPKLFIVKGRYDDFCKFESIKYKGTF